MYLVSSSLHVNQFYESRIYEFFPPFFFFEFFYEVKVFNYDQNTPENANIIVIKVKLRTCFHEFLEYKSTDIFYHVHFTKFYRWTLLLHIQGQPLKVALSEKIPENFYISNINIKALERLLGWI